MKLAVVEEQERQTVEEVLARALEPEAWDKDHWDDIHWQETDSEERRQWWCDQTLIRASKLVDALEEAGLAVVVRAVRTG